VQIRQDLLRDRAVLTGRVTVDACAAPDSTQAEPVAGARVYLENGTYVLTDEQGMFHVEGVRPGSHVVQLDLDSLEPGLEPVICDEQTRFAGRAFSRFVDLQSGSLWRTDFHLQRRATAAAVTGHPAGAKPAAHRPDTALPGRTAASVTARPAVMPKYDAAWLATANADSALLWPPENYSPSIASIRIALKHAPSLQPVVLLNGKAVSVLNFDHRIVNRAGTVALSQWAGVDIEQGNNRLVIELRAADGRLVDTIRREVRMSSLPVRAELVEARSRLIADGKQTPLIAVRLYDRDNQPVREGLVGEYSVEAPYMAQQDVDDLQQQPLGGLDRGKPRYRVGRDGIALIELKPTTRTGEVSLVLPLQQQEVKLRPWLQPAQRDWILVGLAEGSVAHNTVSGNLETLSAAGLASDTLTDGKLSLFAKGTIQGRWLLTLAYDSAKDSEERDRLFQQVNPDEYFTVYGDRSSQDYEASSRDKLYLRIERRQFYALFGDYHTGLTVTELSRYDRALTGYRSEFRNDRYNLNVFASDSGQNFIRDELPGDGTSGLYHLRFTQLVINSDSVKIETRDRFRPQIVLSSRPLMRNIDYNIDYSAGTLFFRQPVPSKDAALNPVYIVVDYETSAAGSGEWVYGGRGAVQLMDKRAEIGATVIRQGRAAGNDRLDGVDATLRLTDATQLKLEYASSRQNNALARDARLAEVKHTSGKLEGSVYFREQEAGFGLGQQSEIGTGTRLYGVDGRYQLTDRTRVTGQAFRQADLQTDAQRDVVETGVVHESAGYGTTAGFRSASDSYTNGTVQSTDQLTLGAHRAWLDDRLNLRLDHSQSLNGTGNPAYPTRTVLGADYLLNPATSLFVEQELTFGDGADGSGTRIGMKTQPWTGATVNSSIEQRYSEYGPRLFANAGLMQAWQVNDRWSVNTSFDSSTTIRRSPGHVPVSFMLPSTTATTEDFKAISLGAGYREDDWSWTSRLERRLAGSEDKWGLYSAATGEPRKGLGLSGRLQWFRTSSVFSGNSTQADLRLGVVQRPFASRWTLLDRADLTVNTADTVTTVGTGSASNIIDGWKVVNNLLLNYRANAGQVSTFYGSRYTRDIIDATDYSGYTDAIGIEVRHDINRHWDVGAQLSTLRGWDSGHHEYACGLSAGFSPATNVWISAGYNWAGYEDSDFNLAGNSAQGAFLKLRFKFDQQSVRETADWFNR